MPSRSDLVPPLAEDRDHQRGLADAPLTLVQFGDYACAFCTEAHPAIEAVRVALGEHLRFAYRHFPVTSPRRSRPAARAAEIAGLYEVFWPLHEALSAEAGATLNEERLFALAGDLGLDSDRFRSDFEHDRGADRVEADYESAQQSGVRGTPAFFLNGHRLDAPGDLERVLADLDVEAGVSATAEEHLGRLRAFL